MLRFMAMIALFLGAPALAAGYAPNLPMEQIDSRATTAEKEIREAAVKISVPFTGGHGSGSYIKHKDVHLVITAQHVARDKLGSSYLVSHKQESHIGTLIYSDEANDIAILYVGNPFRLIKPMKFNPIEETADVGTEIFYSGYPSHHKLMSFTGRVAGHEPVEGPRTGKHIILQVQM